MGHSFPIVALVVFVVFLGILGGLAVAVTKTVNPDGRVSRGFFGGLASAATLVFLCCLALVGTGLFGVALAAGTALDKNPIRHIEVRREPPVAYDDGNLERSSDERGRRGYGTTHDGTLHVMFSVEGDGGEQLVSFLEDIVGVNKRDLERLLTVTEHTASSGETLSVYTLELPIDDDEIDEIEREIRRELDGVRVSLPDSVAITFAGAERW